jgi:Domain of unknown function DUF11
VNVGGRTGRVVDYRITVKNLGPNPGPARRVGDQPLGHATIVAVHPSAGHCQARLRTVLAITCGLGTLQPGGKVTVTVSLRIETNASTVKHAAVAGTATQERTLTTNAATATVHVRARQLRIRQEQPSRIDRRRPNATKAASTSPM